MPIYEFACDRCRKIFQFFFRSASSRKRPKCPRCGRGGLKRRLSRFATGSTEKSRSEGTPPAGDIDPGRLESAMNKLEGEMESIDENAPRQMGRFLRRVMEETGQEVPPDLLTAIKRLEAGEDPEKIEEDMGDLLDGGMDGAGGEYGYDDTLYDA